MNSRRSPKDKEEEYKESFCDLYDKVKMRFSNFDLNFHELVLGAITLSSEGRTNSEVMKHIEESLVNPISYAHRRSEIIKTPKSESRSRPAVWSVISPSGQGKSTLTNAICDKKVADEGKGNHSLTSSVKLHQVKGSNLYVMDTPGFNDTRLDMNDEKIADEIVAKVQKKLEVGAYVQAILLMWNPARCMRLNLDAMLNNLITCFGWDVLVSVVFVINVVTKKWDEECDDAVEELLKDLKSRELNIPVVTLDAKNFKERDFSALKTACQKVRPYREDDFEKHRKAFYYWKFVELKAAEDEKRREQKAIEKWVREEERREAKKREEQLSQRYEEERRQAEEEQRQAEEERRQAEEERKQAEEGRRQAEEGRRQAEERERRLIQRKEEDERRAEEEREEDRKKAQERERKRQQDFDEQMRQQKQQSMSYYASSPSLLSLLSSSINPYSYSGGSNHSYSDGSNNCSASSNIKDNYSGIKTKSGGNDHRDTNSRDIKHLTMNGAPDKRFNCNK